MKKNQKITIYFSQNANIGWSQGYNEYCSKIYVDPRQYVTSIRGDDGEITHEITSD